MVQVYYKIFKMCKTSYTTTELNLHVRELGRLPNPTALGPKLHLTRGRSKSTNYVHNSSQIENIGITFDYTPFPLTTHHPNSISTERRRTYASNCNK